MNLIDTHTHIYSEEFDLDRPAVIERALAKGVVMMMLPNINVASIAPMRAVALARPDLFRVMMGLQPEEVGADYRKELDVMEKELEAGTCAGVGEIGLDFYWDTSFEKQQQDAFATQLDWAKQLGLPVSIHSRNAFEKTAGMLEKYQDGRLKGVMHCFNGTLDEAKAYRGLGFHLGLGGVVTYKNCHISDFLPELPLDRIVLETDAPYLSPVPHRGKRNEPSFLPDTAARIADILQIGLENLADATTENAKRLFCL